MTQKQRKQLRELLIQYKKILMSRQIFPEWFTSCFSLASASFVGSYPLPHALDCLNHATLKSIRLHWKTNLPTPQWTLFLTL